MIFNDFGIILTSILEGVWVCFLIVGRNPRNLDFRDPYHSSEVLSLAIEVINLMILGFKINVDF